MRHSIILTVVLLAIQGTVRTVDGFDFFDFLKPDPIDNNKKVIDGLKKDNDVLRYKNEAFNETIIELTDSLEKEKYAREQAENTLQEEQNLVEAFKQAIDEHQIKLDVAQQQLKTSNQQYGNCTSENEVMNDNMEQLKYSLSAKIKKLQEENADSAQALSSLLCETSDLIASVTLKKSNLTTIIRSAEAETSAIEALYEAFISTHNLTCWSDGSGS